MPRPIRPRALVFVLVLPLGLALCPTTARAVEIGAGTVTVQGAPPGAFDTVQLLVRFDALLRSSRRSSTV